MMVHASDQEGPAVEGLVVTLVSKKQPKQQLQHSFQHLVLAVLAAAAADVVVVVVGVPQTSAD